jgi:hypothetical protein
VRCGIGLDGSGSTSGERAISRPERKAASVGQRPKGAVPDRRHRGRFQTHVLDMNDRPLSSFARRFRLVAEVDNAAIFVRIGIEGEDACDALDCELKI